MTELTQWSPPKTAAIYIPAISSAERANGLPKNLLARLLYQESRFREDIISGETASSAGALGIAQIVPRWHPEAEPLNPFKAIDYAADFLRRLHRQFGSWPKALGAYNWGPGNVKKAIDAHGEAWLLSAPTETKNYVTQITTDVPVLS